MPKDIAVDRVRQLKARKVELKETMAKVVPIRPPPTLYADATIERFRKEIRSTFLAGDNALAKSYLRLLIERIDLTDNEVRIEAKADATLSMMAAEADEGGVARISLPPPFLLPDPPTSERDLH